MLILATEFTVIDKVQMPQVLDYICRRLGEYDTSRLEWLKLLPLNKKAILHGCCTYPVRREKGARDFVSGYRLRASVNVELPPPYLYEHWGRIPSRQYNQGWYSGACQYRFDDLEECALHTLAHECFHFLSHSKQVSHKNTEANANWWADQWLDDFRNARI